MNKIPTIEFLYGIIAVAGGVARYLTSYTQGKPFKISILLASMFISGFSGYMFSLLSISLRLPLTMQFMMAGVGGFFGEQTMNFILEWVRGKL